MKIPIVILTKYRYEHYKKHGFLVKDYQAQIFNDLLVNKMFDIIDDTVSCQHKFIEEFFHSNTIIAKTYQRSGWAWNNNREGIFNKDIIFIRDIDRFNKMLSETQMINDYRNLLQSTVRAAERNYKLKIILS